MPSTVVRATTNSPPFVDGDRVLFLGDSITDCGRVKKHRRTALRVVRSFLSQLLGRTTPLGKSYVAAIERMVREQWPRARVSLWNRALSGNRIVELLDTWRRDYAEVGPTWVSVMIGVNDVWRKREQTNGQAHVPLPEFVAGYRRLVEDLRAEKIEHLVLMSPTTIDPELDSELNTMLLDYAGATRGLARELGAVYVPAREALHAAIKAQPEVQFTTDGCHPTELGHELLAKVWVEAVCGREFAE